MRIPKTLADEIGLKDNFPVQISLHDKQLVVVPVLQPTFSLEALLAQVTEVNRHDEVLIGPAVGGKRGNVVVIRAALRGCGVVHV